MLFLISIYQNNLLLFKLLFYSVVLSCTFIIVSSSYPLLSFPHSQNLFFPSESPPVLMCVGPLYLVTVAFISLGVDYLQE